MTAETRLPLPPLSSTRPLVVYVIGATNAGKSTLLEHAAALYPAQVGLVEIGKALRAKYPPSYFAGVGNPAHTADEAWALLETGVDACQAAGKRAVLVDGQPRDTPQLEGVLRRNAEHGEPQVFLHLWAPRSVRTARAQARDGADPERLALSLTRLDSDGPSNYDILSQLLAAHARVCSFDTSLATYEPGNALWDAVWCAR